MPSHPPKATLVNFDFKWHNKNIVLLEMDDAINASGFQGYNTLHGNNAQDEVMLKKMMAALHEKYKRIHFIYNNTPTYYWPKDQLRDIVYHDKLSDFMDYHKMHADSIDFRQDVMVWGKDRTQSNVAFSRTANEIQALLTELGISIPVINAGEMVDAADDKFILSLLMQSIPQTTLTTFQSIGQNLKSFDADEMLIKPMDSGCGNGIVTLSRQEASQLSSNLNSYFAQSNHLAFGDTIKKCFGKDRQAKLTELHQQRLSGYCLLQSYVSSDPVQHQGKSFDATGRLVVLVTENHDGKVEVQLIDGYWKLPDQPLSGRQDIAERLSHVNVANSAHTGAAAFSTDDFKAIDSALQTMSDEMARLFQSKASFFLNHVNALNPTSKNGLLRYFTNHLLGLVDAKQLEQASSTLTTPGIGSVLTRTLNAEVCNFLSDRIHLRNNERFLQSDLMAYLAQTTCPIDFFTITFANDEREALMLNLNTFNLDHLGVNIPSMSPSLKQHAKGLLQKHQAIAQAKGLKAQAMTYFQNKQHERAQQTWKQLLNMVPNLPTTASVKQKMVSSVNNNLGACCRELGHFTKAIDHFKQAQACHTNPSDDYDRLSKKIERCQHKIAGDEAYQYAKNNFTSEAYENAITLFAQALSCYMLFSQNQDHPDIATCHWAMSSCYLRLNDKPAVLENAQKAHAMRVRLFGAADPRTTKCHERYLTIGADIAIRAPGQHPND